MVTKPCAGFGNTCNSMDCCCSNPALSTVNVSEIEQLNASVTVTEYVPEETLAKSWVTSPLDHE